MSATIQGVLTNSKYKDNVLTYQDGKIVTAKRNESQIKYQTWIAVFNLSSLEPKASIQNEGSGKYLAWDGEMHVITSDYNTFLWSGGIQGITPWTFDFQTKDVAGTLYTLIDDGGQGKQVVLKETSQVAAEGKWSLSA